jgi:dTDP-4-amino-4,6-dideoxygalactose transaminase
MHGQGADRYENVRIGMNSRLDTIQAAVLLEKLKAFPAEIEMRETVAHRYSEAFGASNKIRVPRVVIGAQSTWAQYTIQIAGRDQLQADLKTKGIPAVVYYPIPLSAQKAYRHYSSGFSTPASDRLSKMVISLPMYPDLDKETQDRIIAAVLEGGNYQ